MTTREQEKRAEYERDNPPIFTATNVKTGEVEVIRDLYWFEENYVQGMDGAGMYHTWRLKFVFEDPAAAAVNRLIAWATKKREDLTAGIEAEGCERFTCSMCERERARLQMVVQFLNELAKELAEPKETP